MLDAALRQGIAFPYGCRNGVCGSCKGHILEGEYEYPGGVRVISQCRQIDGCAGRVGEHLVGTKGTADPGSWIRGETKESAIRGLPVGTYDVVVSRSDPETGEQQTVATLPGVAAGTTGVELRVAE